MRPPLVLLAGGKGTRLGDLTKDIPKPMVDVCGKPFLYWLIKHYVEQGFTNITVSTGYKAEVIEEYPWPRYLSFVRDKFDNDTRNFYRWSGVWVLNGDTFIPDPLPETQELTILTCGDIDAGAQFIAHGKIYVHPVSAFYDIGTPSGLEIFTKYALTHLVNK